MLDGVSQARKVLKALRKSDTLGRQRGRAIAAGIAATIVGVTALVAWEWSVSRGSQWSTTAS